MNRCDATKALTTIITPHKTGITSLKNNISSYKRNEWEAIVAIANAEGLIPLFYTSLQEKELLSSITDKELLGYLEAMYKLNETRNFAILQQIHDICSILEKINIQPVLLKGAAALTEKHYAYIGSRVMTDIDFYIPDDRVHEAIDTLKNDGYKEIDPNKPMPKDWHDYRRMYKEDVSAAIEIHRLLLKAESFLFFPKLDLKQMIQPSKSVKNASVLQPTYELYHSFLHSELSDLNYRYKHLDIRHQQHFAQMQVKYNVNFDEISMLINNTSIFKMWDAYQHVQHEYFNAYIAKKTPYAKESRKYITQFNNHLQKPEGAWNTFQTIINMFLYELQPQTLQIRYQYKYKMLYGIYMPYRLLHMLFRYAFRKKTRSGLQDRVQKY